MGPLFETSWKSVGLIVVSAAGIYAAVILLTRLCGKRSFSKMSSFDFAMTVAVGSIIGTTILSSTVRLVDGVVGLAAVYLLQTAIAVARQYKVVTRVVDNTPLLLMDGDRILHANLKKAKVCEADLRARLRQENVIRLGQVKAVVFETTGDISVLHAAGAQPLDPWLLADVRRD